MDSEDKELVKKMVFLCISISAGTFVLLMSCHPPFPFLGNICTYLPDFEIFIGVAIGTVTTAAFFYFIERAQNKINRGMKEANETLVDTKKKLEETNTKLEEIFKAYAARTALFNLKAIFEGGDKRVVANDEQREKFLNMLKKEYIDKYSDSKESVKKVYNLVYGHELKLNHNHKGCEDCKKLIENINSSLEEVKHPFL